jgi:hypothetical protein
MSQVSQASQIEWSTNAPRRQTAHHTAMSQTARRQRALANPLGRQLERENQTRRGLEARAPNSSRRLRTARRATPYASRATRRTGLSLRWLVTVRPRIFGQALWSRGRRSEPMHPSQSGEWRWKPRECTHAATGATRSCGGGRSFNAAASEQ